MKQVPGDVDVVVVTDAGMIIRTPVEQISVISRNSQGVKIMKLKAGTKIVSVAFVEKEEVYEDEEEPETIDIQESAEQPENKE